LLASSIARHFHDARFSEGEWMTAQKARRELTMTANKNLITLMDFAFSAAKCRNCKSNKNCI